ncbi:MAG: hypothetical protein Kow00120_22900 [Anaerolineae bacterium]
MSKLGVHIVIGPRTGFGDFLRRCAQAGQPVPLVKAVDDSGALAEAKGYSDRTVTIFRARSVGDTPPGNFEGNPYQAAEAWMGALMPIWRQNPADFYEILNEPDPSDMTGYIWLNLFTEACLQIAEANGFRLALYSFAAGTPEIDEFARLAPSLKRARKGGHILSLHEYGIPGALRAAYPAITTRYRQFYAHVMIPMECAIPVAITEAAPNGGHNWGGRQFFLNDVAWYDTELVRDPYVLGAALFTLGDWAEANYQGALSALADWIIQHPTPEKPPSDRQYAVWSDNAQLHTVILNYARHLAAQMRAEVWSEDRRKEGAPVPHGRP